MNIGWLKQTMSDVPGGDSWLSSGELIPLSSMGFPKRRTEWRLGRWTAKQAVASYLDLQCGSEDLRRLEIRSNQCGAPEVLIDGNSASVSISLSHRAGVAVCAVGPGHVPIGCDIELVESRAHSFTTDYFTLPEQELVAGHPPAQQATILTLLWSAKESALKALRAGLGMDTLSVEVTLNKSFAPHDPAGMARLLANQSWDALQVSYAPTRQIFPGWWQISNDFVQTLVSVKCPERPVELRQGSRLIKDARFAETAMSPRTAA